MQVLTTGRLTLTGWLPGDVDDLHAIHSDPETMRHVRHGRPETREETVELIDAYRREQAERGWTKWRLADVDGATVGRAGFGGTDDDRQLAYLVRRGLWGRGIASEIAAALVAWHLDHAPGASLSALVVAGNDASARVLAKTGFVEVGRVDYRGAECRDFAHPLAPARTTPPQPLPAPAGQRGDAGGHGG